MLLTPIQLNQCPDNPKAKYVFALMAKREFGKEERLKFAYDPMPPEDRDMRIIYNGLNKSLLATGKRKKKGYYQPNASSLITSRQNDSNQPRRLMENNLCWR